MTHLARMTTPAGALVAPPTGSGGVRLVPVSDALWRVIDRSGRALGHLQQRGTGKHARYAARRFHVASGRFRDLGEFCRASDALDCLRLSR